MSLGSGLCHHALGYVAGRWPLCVGLCRWAVAYATMRWAMSLGGVRWAMSLGGALCHHALGYVVGRVPSVLGHGPCPWHVTLCLSCTSRRKKPLIVTRRYASS